MEEQQILKEMNEAILGLTISKINGDDRMVIYFKLCITEMCQLWLDGQQPPKRQ